MCLCAFVHAIADSTITTTTGLDMDVTLKDTLHLAMRHFCF